MKTLIFNGSPRKCGDTVSLIEKLLEELSGEYLIVNAYDEGISPCVDCRYCWEHDGCSIKDGMQKVYDYIQECDNIVIASPIYFSELTGKLLDVSSRLQRYFCARTFRGETPVAKHKKGAVILVGGGDGNMDKAFDTACTLLHHMNCRDIHELISCHNTNSQPAIEDETVLRGIRDVARNFSGQAIL